MAYRNKVNGSIYVGMKELAEFFYKSRFNRDPLCDPDEGEDIDDSNKHRIYTKSDLIDVITRFGEFFEWAINAKNISRIRFTQDVILVRETRLPWLKKANGFDQVMLPGIAESGKYYLTKAKYLWKLEVNGKAREVMIKLKDRDPEIVAVENELRPQLEVMNSQCN